MAPFDRSHRVPIRLPYSHSNYGAILYRLRDIATYWRKSWYFYTPPVFITPAGWSRRNFVKVFNADKIEWLDYGTMKNYDNMLSRFHLIPERYEQTDRRTDEQTELLYQYRTSVCWRAIKTALRSDSAGSHWGLTALPGHLAGFFFTARRACIAWTMPWQDVYLSVLPSVCLSARLSHVRLLSVRLHVSSNFFHRQVARPFLVFPYQTEWQYSVGYHPPNGDVECKAGMKNRDFRPISRFISGMMQDTVIVTMEGE